MRKQSFGSVKVSFLNRDKAIAEITGCARDLILKDRRVISIRLFGSLVSGRPLPSSDADILIVLRYHHLHRWFDRIPEYLELLGKTTLPVDVFPYTIEEIESAMPSSAFLRKVFAESIELAKG